MRFVSIQQQNMRLLPGLRHGPCYGGAYSDPPDPLASFKGGEGRSNGKGEELGARMEGT